MQIEGYELVFEGTKRYYYEDFSCRDYSLDHCSPYLLKVGDVEFDSHAWVDLIESVCHWFLSLYPNSKNSLLSFHTAWSKADMFSKIKKANYLLLEEGFYVNYNHTSVHSCWFLQDLFDRFGIDRKEVTFLIHRNPMAEPKPIREYYRTQFITNFSTMLKEKYKKDDVTIQKILSNIEKYLDPILRKISLGFDSFFLFDDISVVYNYLKKALELIEQDPRYTDKFKIAMERYGDYLLEYYRSYKEAY